MTTSSASKRLCIVWDWHVDPPELFSDRQEKLQAWRHLTELGWEVDLCVMSENFTYHTLGQFRYHSFQSYHALQNFILTGAFSAIISWGSIDRPIHRLLIPHKDVLPPCALQFAGGFLDGAELSLFSLIFTQNLCDKEEFEFRKFKAVQLFGVDKQFWTPNHFQSKRFKAIYPASFCGHKSNHHVAEEYGEDAILCGKWIEDGMVNACKSFGSTVLPQLTHEVLRELYRSSEKCVIPAKWGSQRTVAEALACGLEVVAEPRNPKCQEILSGKILILDIPEMAEIYDKELQCLISNAPR